MGQGNDSTNFTRRQALAGLGAVLGTSVGCNGDDGSAAESDTSGSSGSDGSSGAADSSSSDSGSGSGGAGSSESSSSGAPLDSSSDGSSSDSTTGEPFDECFGNASRSPEELMAEIDTIVVVMMENRSFDHYLGSAAFIERATFDGLTGRESNPHPTGDPVTVFNLLNLEPEDPPHGWDSCHSAWNNGANDGFVAQHYEDAPDSAAEVMGYHVRAQVPILYSLMDNYTVCDQWHAAVMGPTWPNRYYLHCATSAGETSNVPVALPTIWDVLADAGQSGKNYFSDVPWAWGAFLNPLLSYTESIDSFFSAAASGSLPRYTVIDPNFGLLPGGEGGNDDHPSHNITLGQLFLGSVYQALAQSPQWNRCLIIITYDEHGGFYDHVSPPGGAADPIRGFEQRGFRVPAIVIGPYVRRGCTDHTLYDHVTPIATVSRKFGLPAVQPRVNATNDVSWTINPDYLDNPQPPAATPRLTVSVTEMLRRTGTSQHELADMIRTGDVPLPKGRRHAGASREVALSLLHHAQRLGVATLLP